jgi:hypothetical protein
MYYYEYRIYEVGGERQESVWGLSQPRTLIEQNTLVVDSYEMFKETIQEIYGNIKYRRSNSMDDGDLYCVVVTKSKNEKDFERNQVHEVTCDHCGKEFLYHHRFKPKSIIDVRHRDIINSYRSFDYCCTECRDVHYKKLHAEFIEANDGLNPNEFIDRDSYTWGCIYIITKKRSGEIYIGQTNSLPIFRWGQHLKTERFPMSEIEDYKFEILEVVHDLSTITEIEAKYIKEYAERFPGLILNKTHIKKQ